MSVWLHLVSSSGRKTNSPTFPLSNRTGQLKESANSHYKPSLALHICTSNVVMKMVRVTRRQSGNATDALRNSVHVWHSLGEMKKNELLLFSSLAMEQSYLILEQESSRVFLLRIGKGRLESHKSNIHRQSYGCVTAHHQTVGTGDRSGVESTSTLPDASPAWRHPQVCSFGQCGPKTARTDSKGVALL